MSAPEEIPSEGHRALDRNGRTVNPHILEIARESRRLNQTSLASALGVTQSKVSKYEAGIIAVSSEDLEKLVRVLEYPADFFFVTDSVEGFGSACFHHRKRQGLPVTELHLIHATINVIRMHLTRLLAAVDIDRRNEFARLDVDEYESPEAIAKIVRASWRLPSGPVRSLVSAVENAGGIVVPYSFGTDKIDAVSQWPLRTVPLFFVNKDIPADRWRFSLAHEIGHVIMHQFPPPDAEDQANRFASEFLMPERDISEELESMSLSKAAMLKPRWRVSMQALIRRACTLKRITKRKEQLLFTQMSKLHLRKREPNPIAPEQPTILRDLIEVHTNHLRLGIPEICRIVKSEEQHFRRLFIPDDGPRIRLAEDTRTG
jgi:Zn-dependent peptidase ImmA (M78 family)/transcriptional regulator with XRE-family HTH domain